MLPNSQTKTMCSMKQVNRSGVFKISGAFAVGVLSLITSGWSSPALAIQPQIPTLQVCNQTKIEGRAKVHIGSRSDAEHPGTFGVHVEVKCDPKAGYPRGTVEIVGIGMRDSRVHGAIVATTIEQVTSTGHHSPMAFISGRCRVRHVGPPHHDADSDTAVSDAETDAQVRPLPHPHRFSGCRYWMTLADNRRGDHAFGHPDDTADVVGVMVLNGRGRQIVHGMGPVASGDISISRRRH